MGPMILECRGPWKPSKKGRHSNDVLACPGEVREGFIILDDPLVYRMGHGACAPTVSMALDVSIELHACLLELESCFLKL